MRSDTGSLEYAHARIGSRWGMRPDAAAWRRIEVTRDLPAMLDLARGGSLSRWLHGVAADSGVHAIEAAFRRRWRDAVAELGAWMAPEWRDAIAWCARLADLAAVQHWARGDAPAAWFAHDEVLRGLDAAADAAAPARASAVETAWRALLRQARGEPSALASRWLAAWQALLPEGHDRQAIELMLLPLLRRHAQAFAAPPSTDGWGQRRALEARLVALWRRHPVEPVAVFAHLALQAIELERLRAEVIGRAAFAHRVLHA